jgi:hypothetical protein
VVRLSASPHRLLQAIIPARWQPAMPVEMQMPCERR